MIRSRRTSRARFSSVVVPVTKFLPSLLFLKAPFFITSLLFLYSSLYLKLPPDFQLGFSKQARNRRRQKEPRSSSTAL